MKCATYFLLISPVYHGILKLHLITFLVIKTVPDSLNFALSETSSVSPVLKL